MDVCSHYLCFASVVVLWPSLSGEMANEMGKIKSSQANIRCFQTMKLDEDVIIFDRTKAKINIIEPETVFEFGDYLNSLDLKFHDSHIYAFWNLTLGGY